MEHTADSCSLMLKTVQASRSVVSDSLRPHEPQHARPPCPSQIVGVSQRMSIESVMPSNDLILCRPFLLPSIFPSISVFSNESALHLRWPESWSLLKCISIKSVMPSNHLILFHPLLLLPSIFPSIRVLFQ